MPRPFLATALLAALTAVVAFAVTGCHQAQPHRPAGPFTPAPTAYSNLQQPTHQGASPPAYQGSSSPGGSGTRSNPSSGGSGTR